VAVATLIFIAEERKFIESSIFTPLVSKSASFEILTDLFQFPKITASSMSLIKDRANVLLEKMKIFLPSSLSFPLIHFLKLTDNMIRVLFLVIGIGY